jgi:uncharacterized protein (TIGR03545 family)
MRPKGLIGLAVIALIIGLCIFFFTDDFIEGLIEDIGSSMVGAKVEVDDLKFGLLDLSISMQRLQVTNPNDTWKNLFETRRLSFDMEMTPLFRKKVIINDVTVADVRIGTKRATDGYIPPEETEEDDEPGWVDEYTAGLKKQVADAPVLNLGALRKKVNIDSLMALFDIQSLNKITAAKENAQNTIAKWQNEIADFQPQQDLKKIEADINEIRAVNISQDVAGVQELLATVDKSKKVIDSLNDIKKDIKTKKENAAGDFKGLTTPFTSVDDWINEDFNSIKAKANIGELNAQNVGKMLFGDIVIAPAIQGMEYVGMARKYMPVAQQFMSAGKVEKPKRFEGQDIQFPLFDPKPDFLLEKMQLSASGSQQDTSKAIKVSGEIKGITSDPKIYGHPTLLNLKAAIPNSPAYSITGNLDHTREIAEDRFEIKAAGVHFGKIALPQKPYMPSTILANDGNISANFDIIGKELNFKLNLFASPVNFRFEENNKNGDLIANVVSGVFTSIDQFNLSAGITGARDKLNLTISSNIDDILASRIKGVIGEAANQARAEIKKRIFDAVEPKKQEALAFINSQKEKVTSEIDKIETEVDKHLAAVEAKKKEIEDEIKKKKESGVKDVKDKLKKLF